MKKESIIDVLKNGRPNFECEYPKVDWTPKDFEDKQKKFDRKVRNVCEYGNVKGRAAVYNQPNETAKKLAELLKSPQDCRRYYAMYMEAQKAPHELQRYVFYNLHECVLDDDVNFLNKNCDFYLASILPPKYIKGWENETLFGYKAEYQVEDLTPCDWLKIGTKVVIKSSRREGTIVAYKPLQKLHVHYTWYNTRITARSGKYFAGYVVQYGSNSWQKEDCLFNDIKLPPVEVSMKNEHAMAV